MARKIVIAEQLAREEAAHQREVQAKEAERQVRVFLHVCVGVRACLHAFVQCACSMRLWVLVCVSACRCAARM